MKILYSWLKDYIAIRESPEKLAEILNLYAFETSIVQKMKNDAVFDVELFPNRVGDCASHVGLARELAMILKRPLKAENRKWKIENSKSKMRTSDFVIVKVEDLKLCPRYSARVVLGVKVGQSPAWLKKRLAACGLRPINNVVDITNYVMLELGEPLHAFDWEKIAYSGQRTAHRQKQIIVRRARDGEVIEALDAAHYTLHAGDLVIADNEGPLALAGIKGGKRAEITKRTKDVALEAANFDPTAIRKTSKRLGLRTDSSWRFENGMDPNLTTLALDRAAALIQKICGGEIAKGVVDVYPKKALPRPIVVDLGRLHSLLGSKIPAGEIISLLGPTIVSSKIIGKDKVLLKVRTERRDLLYPEDIAEEVARVRGLEKLRPQLPVVPLTAPRRNESIEFREMLRNHLVGLGFSEVCTYSLTSDNDAAVLALNPKELVEIANPISSEYQYLRRYLLVNHLKKVRDNLRFFPEVRVFEIGTQYRWKESRVDEQWRASGILARKGATANDLFFEAKGVVESLFERLGFDRDDYVARDVEDQHFLPGAAIEFSISGRDVARIGVFHPEFTRAYDIEAPAVCWIIGIEALRQEVREEHEYEPPHKYPDVIRDISMLVPRAARVEQIQNVIHGVSPKYLEDIDLFDIYEEPGFGEDKKSLAFHLIFRADNHTLTDEEVGKEIEKINKALKEFGAEIR